MKRVLLTGGSGMLGQAVLRAAEEASAHLCVLAPKRSELALESEHEVARFLREEGVDAVLHGAARVGGIQANVLFPVEFLVENLALNNGVILGARRAGVSKLLFLGSSCMYPKDYQQPLKEGYMLAAPLEPTNEGYALAKIAGARLCEYISRQEKFEYSTVIACNLFGVEDHFDNDNSHLIAAVIRKVEAAVARGEGSVEIWGSGHARREFLLVDDLARFLVRILESDTTLPRYLNTGYGSDYSVRDYYAMVARILGFAGEWVSDLSKPEGMQRKLLDSSLARRYGWGSVTPMYEALAHVVKNRKPGKYVPKGGH